MFIKLQNNCGRRCAYTDRKNGYIELICDKEDKNNGYYRGNKKLCSGFTLEGHSFNEADSVNVYPYGYVASYGSKKLSCSLLLDEQAFYVAASKNIGVLDLALPVEPVTESTVSDSTAELDTELPVVCHNPTWTYTTQDGVYVLSSDIGVSVSASFDFYYNYTDSGLELHVRDGENSFSSDSEKALFTNKGWYIVFEDTEESASSKAIRLLKENAIETHLFKINSFLDKCHLETGDKKFDESIDWARFNGWLLATKDHDSDYRGIWAGLPWFRDNWGRDTFISLCGILLATGCVDEAKEVLLGFAGFQDLDKKSASYGHIPNRYRSREDVIYNTIDGTLWFIRAVWEYVQYSGDTSILKDLHKTIETALDSDITRCDSHGFLLHGDADTWMDARIKNKEPLSPRGTRANDIQVLWFTALKLGSYFMKEVGETDKASLYESWARKVRSSYDEFFYNKDCSAYADCLPEGGYGEWAKDMRVRPNQLFTITVPYILPQANVAESNDNAFISRERAELVIENCNRELVSPFGLFSLSSNDPIFHADHERPELYHKDAAYHNGTIWEWNSGPYITSCAMCSNGVLPSRAEGILQNEAKMIMEMGCAGSLSENIHARPRDGRPVLSGTFSQAWSVAEYVRNMYQDVMGFLPRLGEGRIELRPCFPEGQREISAKLPFGPSWFLHLKVIKHSHYYECHATWNTNGCLDTPSLKINEVDLLPNEEVSFNISIEEKNKSSVFEKFGLPSKFVTSPFNSFDFDREFCGATHVKDYYMNLVLSGRMQSRTSGGPNTAALEWYFDSEDFKSKYVTDVELGAIYKKDSTTFRLWAPTSNLAYVILYKDSEGTIDRVVPMKAPTSNDKGVWSITVNGDLEGCFYEYGVLVHGVYNHCIDPYAHACSVNGKYACVVDMSKTNPEGWEDSSSPKVDNPCDVIGYELHVADLSSNHSWNGLEERRTFNAVHESGTTYKDMATGFDYIKSLGVTHVQLLPVFDYRSVDESKTHDEEYAKRPTFGLFNWGYDPQNYACIEGSYSTDPFKPEVRIKEFKSMIKAFNDEGIGIIMDVVYNHVNDGLHQSLGVLVPGYFFRVEGYSGAGEDTASERAMYQKYMVDTLSFWLKEYKLSGFRFDLMGLHDVDTMNAIVKALREIKKDVLVYGEGWNMYNAGKMVSANMCNCTKMPGVSHFNDAVRCAIKGPINSDMEMGFVHNGNRRESVKFGITGAVKHPDVEYTYIEGTAHAKPWSETSWTSINYTEIHDNMTMNDKFHMVEPSREEEHYNQIAKMALSLVLLSEGLPILHAGQEFLRTKEIPEDILKSGATFYDVAVNETEGKSYLRNSYNVCDRINGLDWARMVSKADLVDYTRSLIKLRKEHKAFRMSEGKDISENLSFVDNFKAGLPKEVLAWTINGSAIGDSYKNYYIIANPLSQDVKFTLPGKDSWTQLTDGIEFKEKEAVKGGNVVSVLPKTVSVFVVK